MDLDSTRQIDIQEIVSPIDFWIVPPRTQPLNPKMEAILIMETDLKKLATYPKNQITWEDLELLREGQLVAVGNESGRWHRARIDKLFYSSWDTAHEQTLNSMKVFLVDWALTIRVELPNKSLCFIPDKYALDKMGGIARLLPVEGLVPLGLQVNHKQELCLVPSDTWSEKALEFVTDLINDSESQHLVETTLKGRRVATDILFKFPANGCKNPQVKSNYGDFKPNLENVMSLKKNLVEGKFAVEKTRRDKPPTIDNRAYESARANAPSMIVPSARIEVPDQDPIVTDFSIRELVEKIEPLHPVTHRGVGVEPQQQQQRPSRSLGRGEALKIGKERRTLGQIQIEQIPEILPMDPPSRVKTHHSVVPAGIDQGRRLEDESKLRQKKKKTSVLNFIQNTSTSTSLIENQNRSTASTENPMQPIFVAYHQNESVTTSGNVEGSEYNAQAEYLAYQRTQKKVNQHRQILTDSNSESLDFAPLVTSSNRSDTESFYTAKDDMSLESLQQAIYTGTSSQEKLPELVELQFDPKFIHDRDRPVTSSRPCSSKNRLVVDSSSESQIDAVYLATSSRLCSSTNRPVADSISGSPIDTGKPIISELTKRMNRLRLLRQLKTGTEKGPDKSDSQIPNSETGTCEGPEKQKIQKHFSNLYLQTQWVNHEHNLESSSDISSTIESNTSGHKKSLLVADSKAKHSMASSSAKSLAGNMSPDSEADNRNQRAQDFLLVHREKGSRLSRKMDGDRLRSNFNPTIVRNLEELGVSQPTPEQARIWPIIKDFHSLVSVQVVSTTLNFVTPIVDMIVRGEYPENSHRSPLAVVLCPSWKNCEQVLLTFQDVGRGCTVSHDSFPFSVLAIHENEEKRAVDLANGCHVLITTPTSLERMVNKKVGYFELTNLDCCHHLILQEADKIFASFNVELVKVMRLFRESSSKQKFIRQNIVIAREWTQDLKFFFDKFLRPQGQFGPYIVISRPLEAVIYGQIRVQVEVLESEEERLDRCLSIIQQVKSNCVVCCNDIQSVSKIQNFLEENGQKTYSISEGQFVSGAKRIIMEWKMDIQSKKSSTLILSDMVDTQGDFTIESLQLTDEPLLHFELPQKSLKTFGYRFFHFDRKVCFKNYYNNPTATGQSGPIRSYVLVDKYNNVEQVSTLRSFIERTMGATEVPKDLKLMNWQREVNSATATLTSNLCFTLKAMGACPKKLMQAVQLEVGGRTCKERHFILKDVDIGKSILGPDISDLEIRYFVVTVITPVHFYARLKEAKNIKSKSILIDYTVTYAALSFKLSQLQPSDLKLVETFKQDGPLLLFRDRDFCYKRAQVIKVVEGETNSKVSVFLIDEGRVIVDKSTIIRLWELPESFGEDIYPRHTVEIVIANIKPKDKDAFWSEAAGLSIRDSLLEEDLSDSEDSDTDGLSLLDDEDYIDSSSDAEKNDNIKTDTKKLETSKPDRNLICRSAVLLTLGNTVIVKQVQVLEKTSSEKWNIVFEVTDSLLRQKFGERHPDHIFNLIKILSDLKIDLSRFETLMKTADQLSMETSKTSTDSATEKMETDDPQVEEVVTSFSKAFLDKDKDTHDVFITEVLTPDIFYVRQSKFDPQLKRLEKTLQELWNDSPPSTRFSSSYDIVLNQLALLKESDELYARVQITDFNDESGDVNVYYIDFGIVVEVNPNQLMPIPKAIIECLPGQAIACCLVDVIPMDEAGWSVETNELLLKMSNNGETLFSGMFKGTSNKNGLCRVLNLYNTDTKKFVGDELLALNLVQLNPDLLDDLIDLTFRKNGLHTSDPIEEPSNLENDLPTLDPDTLKVDPTAPEGNPTALEGNPSALEPKSDSDMNNQKLNVKRHEAPGGNCPLWQPNFSVDLPGFRVLPQVNLNICSPREIQWRNSQTEIHFHVFFDLMLKLDPMQVSLQVEPQTFQIEYLGVNFWNEGKSEEYVLHRVPKLNLFSPVDPQKTVVKFLDNSVKVTLFKLRPIFWPRPSSIHKWSGHVLYKRADDKIVDSDDEDDEYRFPDSESDPNSSIHPKYPAENLDESQSESEDENEDDGTPKDSQLYLGKTFKPPKILDDPVTQEFSSNSLKY